jgi:hypothetical protein
LGWETTARPPVNLNYDKPRLWAEKTTKFKKSQTARESFFRESFFRESFLWEIKNFSFT